MTLHRPSPGRSAAGLALLGLGTAWLALTPPAQAEDISDRDVERAREACKDIAHNRDWRVEDTHLRDKDEDRGRVVITVQGRRGGEDRERECRYNVKTRDAEFDG